ncbi:MAG: hypothetical protein GXO21_06530 [Aquificae bacterium]|nr:hypothetical protein [Aquificota bacterium]
MKKNRDLILLLISILIYVVYIPSYDEKIKTLIDEIKYLNLKVSKEESILEKKEEILAQINKSLEIAQKNESLIFKDKNDSEIQSEVQNYLKNIALSYETNFLGASWDEPLVYEEYNYKELPMNVSVKGTPPSVAKFFIDMFEFEKLIQLKSLEIGRTRPLSLLFAFKVSTYKLITSEKEKENE